MKIGKKIGENNVKTIIFALLLLVIIGIAYNFKVAIISVSTILGTAILISNFIDFYRTVKGHNFDIKSIISLNWKYYGTSTIIVGLVYIFLLPKKMVLVSGILILCVLGGLLILDLIRTIFKF